MLDDGVRVPYDWLVVAVGTETVSDTTPGAKENAVALSTMEDGSKMAAAMRELIAKHKGGRRRGKVAVVGGGLSGVELAGVAAERLGAAATVTLLTPSTDIMAASPPGQREAARKVLQSAGVSIRTGLRALSLASATAEASDDDAPSTAADITLQPTAAAAASVSSSSSSSSSGETFTETFDLVCWTVGQRSTAPSNWPFARDNRNRLKVESTLRAEGHARIFALGDAAVAPDVRDGSWAERDVGVALPGTAQVAFQQAGAHTLRCERNKIQDAIAATRVLLVARCVQHKQSILPRCRCRCRCCCC